MGTVLARQPGHVADAAALLSLLADQLLQGDVYIRDDNDTPYMLIGDDPGVLSSWKALSAPDDSLDISGETDAREAADVQLQANIDNETSTRITAVANEASIRAAADTSIAVSVTNEATARANADTNEATARANAVANEATARTAADATTLSTATGRAAAFAIVFGI
jgi:hypothetical protein